MKQVKQLYRSLIIKILSKLYVKIQYYKQTHRFGSIFSILLMVFRGVIEHH